MSDSADVTGAAVQVRLDGPLFVALEDWRRAQPKIIPRSGRSSSCFSERWPIANGAGLDDSRLTAIRKTKKNAPALTGANSKD